MEILLNGTPRSVRQGSTIAALVGELQLEGPYAVEINQAIVPRSQHDEHPLAPGDRIEIVTFVGGG